MPSAISEQPTAGPSQAFKRNLSDVEDADVRGSKKVKTAIPHDAKDKKRRRRKRRKLPLIEGGRENRSSVEAVVPQKRRVLIKDVSPSSVSHARILSGSNSSSTLATSDASPIPTPTGVLTDVESSESKIQYLTAQLAERNKMIEKHENALSQLQQSMTCQICLELMYKPFALAPCGHLACYDCLVQWFKAPPTEGPPPPTVLRKKTCPHCRAVVKERPVEVWGMKSMVGGLAKSGLLKNINATPATILTESGGSDDPWAGIFRKPSNLEAELYHHMFGIYPPPSDPPQQGQDFGMYDQEDGGIYRCLDCLHEIWDGACSSCGRVYPGHNHSNTHDDEDGYDTDLPWISGFQGWLPMFPSDEESEEDNGEWAQRYLQNGSRAPNGSEEDVDVDLDLDDEEEDEDENEKYESDFIDDADDRGITRQADVDVGDVGSDSNGSADSDEIRVPRRRIRPRHRELVDSEEDRSEIGPPREASSDSDEVSAPQSRLQLRRQRIPRTVSSEGDEDASSSPIAPRRVLRRRQEVPSDDEGSSETSYPQHYSDYDSENESDLAERIAQAERDLYGDDGSTSRSRLIFSESDGYHSGGDWDDSPHEDGFYD